jgi:hypothetical protein
MFDLPYILTHPLLAAIVRSFGVVLSCRKKPSSCQRVQPLRPARPRTFYFRRFTSRSWNGAPSGVPKPPNEKNEITWHIHHIAEVRRQGIGITRQRVKGDNC